MSIRLHNYEFGVSIELTDAQLLEVAQYAANLATSGEKKPIWYASWGKTGHSDVENLKPGALEEAARRKKADRQVLEAWPTILKSINALEEGRLAIEYLLLNRTASYDVTRD